MADNLLNDLFTNNVDFVAKQMQTLIDFLYPDTDDNSETDFPLNPVYITGLIKVQEGLLADKWYTGNVYYNLNFDSYSDENALTFVKFEDNASQQFVDLMTPFVNQAYLYGNSSYKDIPMKLYRNYDTRVVFAENNTAPSFSWGVYYNELRQKSTYLIVSENQSGQTSLYWPYSYGQLDLLTNDGGKVFIVTNDVPSAQYIYNNMNYNNDYHTSNTYNYGDTNIYAGGGAGGIVVAPVGMFNYGEFKLALDSLIDDLNLNFSNSDNQFPIAEFPSYDDIKYEDMGSFYITPIKQIDTLPEAPDVGDTVPDISDYLSIVGGAVSSFYNMIDGLGVSLMLVFTFLICLVINHLKKE